MLCINHLRVVVVEVDGTLIETEELNDHRYAYDHQNQYSQIIHIDEYE